MLLGSSRKPLNPEEGLGVTKGSGSSDQGSGWSDLGVQGVLPFVGRVRKAATQVHCQISPLAAIRSWACDAQAMVQHFHFLPVYRPSYIPSSPFPTTVYRQKIVGYDPLAESDRFVTCLAISIADIATGDVLATPKHKFVF